MLVFVKFDKLEKIYKFFIFFGHMMEQLKANLEMVEEESLKIVFGCLKS